MNKYTQYKLIEREAASRNEGAHPYANSVEWIRLIVNRHGYSCVAVPMGLKFIGIISDTLTGDIVAQEQADTQEAALRCAYKEWYTCMADYELIPDYYKISMGLQKDL